MPSPRRRSCSPSEARPAWFPGAALFSPTRANRGPGQRCPLRRPGPPAIMGTALAGLFNAGPQRGYLAAALLASAGCLSIANPQFDGPEGTTGSQPGSSSGFVTTIVGTTEQETSTTAGVVGSSSDTTASASVDSTGDSTTTSGSSSGSSSGSGDTAGVVPSTCCEPGGNMGCDDPKIEACVCAAAPACCLLGWTAKCVATVETTCGGCPDFEFDCSCDQFCFPQAEVFSDTVCASGAAGALDEIGSLCAMDLGDCTCSNCVCIATGVAGACG